MRAKQASLPERLVALAGGLVLAVALFAPAAQAHKERPSHFPRPPGRVPQYRSTGPYLVVCRPDTANRIARLPQPWRSYNQALYRECLHHGFRNIQAAVDAVRAQGTRILIQPGRYLEKPSLRPQRDPYCRRLARGDTVLTYGQQVRCPHVQNLIAILGDGPDRNFECDRRLCRLQIEGTGARPQDVVVDGRFRKLNVIRADRADGVYFRNFTVQRSTFNALYVIETDGFVIDRMVGRWNDEYGFLTFASDHGLYTNCEAYGNGDGGLYPGSASDIPNGKRPAVEITRCRSHHNLLGLSGTAGNNLYVHDNLFYDNTVGATMDSAFPDHPGLPQDSSTFLRNRIFSNNQDYYRYHRDGTCRKPSAERGYERGVVCPAVGVPVGTGLLLAGGNENLFAQNWIYDNWRYGAMQFWVPAAIRNETDPAKQYDTSHFNRYVRNRMGLSPGGRILPNGIDFFWDEEGEGNCWQGNETWAGHVTSDPPAPLLPTCRQPNPFRPGNPAKSAYIGYCALTWSPENSDPQGCDWYHTPPKPMR